MSKISWLIGIVTVSSKFAMAQNAPGRILQNQIKTVICDAYAQQAKNVILPECVKASFYDSDPTNADSEVSFVLEKQMAVTICKFYVTKSINNPKAELDGCQFFAAPKSCAQSVRNAVAVTLAQKFPSVAQSFMIENIKYLGMSQDARLYAVATTDEVENEQWRVQALGNKNKCAVTAVELLD